MSSNLFQDLLVLIGDCVRQMFAADGRSGLAVVVAAVCVSTLCYLLCHQSTKLWNRRFQVRLIHHVCCAATAVVGFVAVILYASCPFMKAAAAASILVWQEEIQRDEAWSIATFEKAYDEVRQLGAEPPGAFEQSRKEDRVVPAGAPESQYKLAAVYCNAASRHFAEQRPLLSKLIRPNPDIPEEPAVQDTKAYFASPAAHDTQSGRKNPYPLRRTIELVARLMRQDLEEQVPLIATRAQVSVLVTFLIIQAALFGGIGLAAYRDLKLRV